MSSSSEISNEQRMALQIEIDTSIKLIQLGFTELQKINFSNDFYYLPLQLLSSGFERLMKCIICLGHLEKNGSFPNQTEIKTHGLIALKNCIISDFFSTKVQATEADFEFINTDEDLQKVLHYLSEFGKQSRYYNLDVITGANPSLNVESIWEYFELDILKRNPELFRSHTENSEWDKGYDFICREIITTLERFARALVRQFTLGDLGHEAFTFSGSISPFLLLTDEQLGKTKY